MERKRSIRNRAHSKRESSSGIHVIDFMSWMTGDSKGHGRPRTIFGDGGRRSTGRRTLHGRRRLQEQYESRRLTGFSATEIADIRQIFEFYDVENTKTMDLSELDVALRALGYNLSVSDVDKLTSLMDVDGDSSVDFGEFCMILEHLKEMQGDTGDLRDSFRSLDHNEDGTITTSDLVNLLTTKGEDITLKEAYELISFADRYENGTIDYHYLVEALQIHDVKKKSLSTSVVASKSQSSDATPSQSSTGVSETKKSQVESKKTKVSAGTDIESAARYVEPVNSVIKALVGPILLNSAIIITSQTGRKKPGKWACIKRALKTKSESSFNNKQVVEISSEEDSEEFGLLEKNPVQVVITTEG